MISQTRVQDGHADLIPRIFPFICEGPAKSFFAERPPPDLRDAPNDVIVAINYTGVCGSDVHYFEHAGIGSYGLKDGDEPLVLGHEAVGTVVQVGSAVAKRKGGLQPGDRVAIEPGVPCRHCSDCLSGQYHLCDDVEFAASPPHHGTLTGFYAVADDFCYKLPPSVSLREGALVEPLAVAVHIARQAVTVGALTPGCSVLVLGSGPVGLLCAAVARYAFGASVVVSVDVVPSKLAVASELGATHTYLAQSGMTPAENAARILETGGLRDNGGANVVLEASGITSSILTALHAVRRGGCYVQGGMGRSEIDAFPIMALCMKEVTVRGSFRYGSGDFQLAVKLIDEGKVDVKKLITGVVSFPKAEAAIGKVKEGGVIKILIAGPNEVVGADEELPVD